MNIEDLKIIGADELQENYPFLMDLLNQLPENPSKELIASLIINICPHCRSELSPCFCMHDD